MADQVALDMKSESVCAVVVTYNRKNLLLECLEALRKQTRPVQGIYLIDNASADGTPEVLLEEGYIEELPPDNLTEVWERKSEIKSLIDGRYIKFYYVRMPENTGSSGGFYEGVKRAYEKGYSWLWLMDDDAEPKDNALEELLKFSIKKGVSALAPLKVDLEGRIIHPHRGFFDFEDVFSGIVKVHDLEKQIRNNRYIEIDHASFVGILIYKKSIEKIGFPKSCFFIHCDDVEYCIRLRRVGKILLIPSSVIVHKEAAKECKKKKFLWKEFCRIPYERLWLMYYGMRNLVWIGKKYSTSRFNFWKGFIMSMLRSILGIILFDDHKLRRIYFVISAYLDGIRGNFNNEKPKIILYKKKD